MRAPRVDDRPRYDETRSSSSEPWSEVPPELEELLRAELSRKAPMPSMSETAAMAPTAPAEPVAEAKPARRTRATTPKSGAESAPVEVTAQADAAPVKAARTRTTKTAATKTTTPRTRKAATTETGDAAAAIETGGAVAPKKPATRRKTATTAPSVEEL